MRGQCGIAVVAATLATATGSSAAEPRDAVAAPPHVAQAAMRRKPGRVSPSMLEAAAAIAGTRQQEGSPPADHGDGNPPLLRALPKSRTARRQASCADATGPCSRPLLPRSGRTQARQRVRQRGFVGPTDAAGGDGGRASRPRGAGTSNAGARAVAAGDMHGEVLLVRGGGTSWFGRSDYDEFPPDFDYGADEGEDGGTEADGGVGDSTALCWPEDEGEPAPAAPPPARDEDSMVSAAALQKQKQQQDLKLDFLEEEDAFMKDEGEEVQGQGQGEEQEQGRRRSRSGRPDRKKMRSSASARLGQGGGGNEGGSADSRAQGLKSSGAPRWPASVPEDDGNFAASSALTAATAPERGGIGDRDRTGLRQGQGHGQRQQLQRSVIGAVVGALAGAVGLKLWEALAQRRGGGGGGSGDGGGGGDGGGAAKGGEVEVAGGGGEGGGGEDGAGQVQGAATATEEAVGVQQAKIQALEDQLAYLEEDRRRVLLAAKEARSNRRKDDRQLKEYVHTLEVHLDQLSKEKQESETAMVEKVRAETAKALEQAQQGTQAAAAKAAEEVKRARGDLESTKVLLEEALQQKEAAVQEKAAGYALLRTEQGKGAALEKEVERLRESTVALTQRLLDTVAEAERAGKDEREAIQAKADEATEAAVAEAVAAAREEETARCREEMEAALAEEKEKLRKQMEARVATMRAGLKRRLQEARAERTGTARIPSSERATAGVGSSINSSSSSQPK